MKTTSFLSVTRIKAVTDTENDLLPGKKGICDAVTDKKGGNGLGHLPLPQLLKEVRKVFPSAKPI